MNDEISRQIYDELDKQLDAQMMSELEKCQDEQSRLMDEELDRQVRAMTVDTTCYVVEVYHDPPPRKSYFIQCCTTTVAEPGDKRWWCPALVGWNDRRRICHWSKGVLRVRAGQSVGDQIYSGGSRTSFRPARAGYHHRWHPMLAVTKPLGC